MTAELKDEEESTFFLLRALVVRRIMHVTKSDEEMRNGRRRRESCMNVFRYTSDGMFQTVYFIFPSTNILLFCVSMYVSHSVLNYIIVG